MRYRIVERKNMLTHGVMYAVEMEYAEGLWFLCRYYDEAGEPRQAFFRTVREAEEYIGFGCEPVTERTVKTIDANFNGDGGR